MNTPPWGTWRDTKDYLLAQSAWVLGWLPIQDATWVAAAALEDGIDTQEIRLTAGLLNPQHWEHRETIGTALEAITSQALDDLGAAKRILLHQLNRLTMETHDGVVESFKVGIWFHYHGPQELSVELLEADPEGRWLKYLQRSYYAYDDSLEWGGKSAPKSDRLKGDEVRDELVQEAREWAVKELQLLDPKP